MVAERAFRLFQVFADGAGDDKIGIAGKEIIVAPVVSKTAATHQAGKSEFRKAFRQRHDGRKRMRRRAAYKNGTPEWLVALQVLRVVHADAAVQLVVQPDFAIRDILVARKLDAVHADIALHGVPTAGGQRKDLRQGDKCATVVGPGFYLG